MKELYGGESPFRDLRAFKHYLASTLQQLGDGDNPFLWHSTTTKAFVGIVDFINYDVDNGKTKLIRGEGSALTTAPSLHFTKDAFVATFLKFETEVDRSPLRQLKADTNRKIKEEMSRSGTYDASLLENHFSRLNNDDPDCVASIILIQAHILYFFKNKGKITARNRTLPWKNETTFPGLGAGSALSGRNLIDMIFPKTKSLNEKLTTLIPATKFKELMQKNKTTFQDLKLEMTKWTSTKRQGKLIPASLFDKAIVSLKEPNLLVDCNSLHDAYKESNFSGIDDAFGKAIVDFQTALVQTEDNFFYKHAALSVAIFGIITPAFLAKVATLRTNLDHFLGTEDVNRCKLAIDEFIKVNGLPGRFRPFDIASSDD